MPNQEQHNSTIEPIDIIGVIGFSLVVSGVALLLGYEASMITAGLLLLWLFSKKWGER